MKKIYLVLYFLSIIIYVIYIPFYALSVINNHVIHQTAYLNYIKKKGGRSSHNDYYLVDKDYRLTRSRTSLGSILSRKEISPFDLETINNRPTSKFQNINPSREISFYIDTTSSWHIGLHKVNKINGENGWKLYFKKSNLGNSYTPIALRKGNVNNKDFWYYFTLLSYANHTFIPFILLVIQILLGLKCSKIYKNKITYSLIGITMFFVVLLFCIF